METLGVTYTNWKTKVMRFNVGETQVELQGDHSLTKAQVALKTMAKSLKHGSEGVLAKLNHLGTKGRPHSTEVPKDLEEMIQRFKEVFNMPKALPPVRGREHAIVLKEGARSINVRPYRYPQLWKDEI